jgi:phytanoyl-CoA hydroxylase
METQLDLHPWNMGFEWADARSPGCRLSDLEVDAFNRDGYLLLRSCIPVGLVEQVRAATDEAERLAVRRLAESGGRSGISETGAITFSAHLVAGSHVLRQFATYPLFPELAIDLIGPDVNLYWDQLVYKKPEKPRRFPWHQDNGYAFIVPQHYLTCWIPLVEATPDNGCPHLAPGIHRYGTLAHEYVEPLGWQCFDHPPNGSTVAACSPGDVVVFSSLSPHLTGPNLTHNVRKTYILQYATAGSVVLQGDPKAGEPTGRVPITNPSFQFPVARRGRPVT